MKRPVSSIRLSVFFFWLVSHHSFGQGIVASALGLEGTAVADGAALFQNPAMLAKQQFAEISIQHYNHFRIGNWNDLSIFGSTVTSPRSAFSAGYSLQGFPGFQTHILGIASGMTCSKKIAVGIAGGIEMMRIGDALTQSSKSLMAKAGLTYSLSSLLQLGVVINNPHRWITVNEDPESKSTEISAGISYEPSRNFTWYVELNHDMVSGSCNSGIQYNPGENIACRIGYNGASKQISAGLGFLYKILCIDAAVLHHPFLGVSTGISIRYSIISRS